VSGLVPDPAILAPAFGLAALYRRGWRRRPTQGPDRAQGGEPGRFLLGLAAVVAALAPGVEQLAHRSFAGHMAQHLLLVLVAAPLLGTARPVTTLMLAVRTPTPVPSHRSAGTHWVAPLAVAAGSLHLATMLAWHLPPLYDAAVASSALHRVEHASLLGTAVLAWAAVAAAARCGDGRALVAVVVLALNALAGAGLGVVLLSAPLILYDSYATAGPAALDAQRLGGAMMKVGSVVVHAGAAVWIATAWLSRIDRDGSPAGPDRVAARLPDRL
jgi:putative membrane protein